MENIFKKKLQEEIQKFILLSNYNTKKTLTENELDDDPFGDLDTNTIPGTLRGDSENKSGKLNFSGVIDGTSTYGIFKNKGYIPSLSKKDIIGIRSASSAVKKGIVIPKTEPQTQPKKSTEVKNIDIEISIEDPFIFNTINLYPEAEKNIKYFIDTIKSIPSKYNQEIYNKYLNFIKSKTPIYVNAYASKDGNPDDKINSGYGPCRGYGNGTRSDYDKCLSIKRAEYIVKLIEDSLPDFVGVFKPLGHGQTTKFNNIGWPNSKNTEETKPNRRFDVNLPVFEYSEVESQTPNEIPKQINKTQKGKTLDLEKNLIWDLHSVFPNISEGVTIKYRLDKNSGYIVTSLNELAEAFGGYDTLKQTLPMISSGKFNNDQITKTSLSKNGITITTNEGVFTWKNWTTSEASSYDVTSLMVTEFKPVATIVKDGDIYIKEMGFTLNKIPKI